MIDVITFDVAMTQQPIIYFGLSPAVDVNLKTRILLILKILLRSGGPRYRGPAASYCRIANQFEALGVEKLVPRNWVPRNCTWMINRSDHELILHFISSRILQPSVACPFVRTVLLAHSEPCTYRICNDRRFESPKLSVLRQMR